MLVQSQIERTAAAMEVFKVSGIVNGIALSLPLWGIILTVIHFILEK